MNKLAKPIIITKVIDLEVPENLNGYLKPPNDNCEIKLSWRWTDFFGNEHNGHKIFYEKVEIENQNVPQV